MTNSALIPSAPRRRAFVARLRRFRLGRRAALVAMTVGLASGVGAPAAFATAPTTFCVHYSGYTCPSGSSDEGDNLQTALDAASMQPASADAPNVVDVGPGSYASGPSGFSYASSNPLRIIGAGANATVLTGAAGASDVLSLGDDDTSKTVSISGVALTIQANNGTGLALNGGAADHITVTSPQPSNTGVMLDGATLSSSVISDANFNAAVETRGQASELDDDTVNGNSFGVIAGTPTKIHRITAASGDFGVFALSAPVWVDDSLVKAVIGLDSDDGGLNALNDTLIGVSGAQAGVLSYADASNASDIEIRNSIIYAFPYSFETSSNSGSLAEINASVNNYDGLSYGSDISRSQSIGSDPGFVDALGGDYHLAFNSSLIDASSIQSVVSDSSSTDLDGNPRVVVDGNAGAPVDLGAYEYQHRAPEAQVKATPSSGAPGTVFSFDSAGSRDADDGDHLSYSWSFDDGASASGATASHAFSTPGPHTATLTVSDSSGLTSTATATVTVTGGTASPGTGTGTPTGTVGSAGTGTGQNATAQTVVSTPGAGTHGRPVRQSGKVTIRISRRNSHDTSITVRLSCGRAARCSAVRLTVTTTAHHRSITIGTLRLNLRRGQTRTLTLKLNHNGRALLASVRKLAITITAHLGGTPATSVTTAHGTVTA